MQLLICAVILSHFCGMYGGGEGGRGGGGLKEGWIFSCHKQWGIWCLISTGQWVHTMLHLFISLRKIDWESVGEGRSRRTIGGWGRWYRGYRLVYHSKTTLYTTSILHTSIISWCRIVWFPSYEVLYCHMEGFLCDWLITYLPISLWHITGSEWYCDISSL